jgi:hypothetical protein
MSKGKLFKDGPDGVQLHAGKLHGKRILHSDDGGKTWWSGTFIQCTRKELIDLAVSILQDTPNTPAHEPRKETNDNT